MQSFLILLNRQRDERTTRSTSSTSPPAYPNTLAGVNSTTYTSSTGGDGLHHQAPIRGRPLVINSSVQLLQTFLFFSHRHPENLISWTIGQQAFNAAMIIILDAWETDNEQNMWLVDEAHKVFVALQGVHKLAALAVSRITQGMLIFNTRQRERQDAANAAAAAAANAAAMSRRSSQQQQQHQHFQQQQQPIQVQQAYHYTQPEHLYQPILSLNTTNTASLNISGNSVMGNSVMGETGMFLLEDSGYAVQQHFAPWSLSLPASAAASSPQSSSATSPTATTLTGQYSPPVPPMVPVSNVPIAPFPVISPSFQPQMVPMLASPFAVGLQPRMPMGSGRSQQGQGSPTADAAAAQQHYQHSQAMQGQPRQQVSRHGHSYSPYQTQTQTSRRGGGASQGSSGHRLERPPTARSRSGRTR